MVAIAVWNCHAFVALLERRPTALQRSRPALLSHSSGWYGVLTGLFRYGGAPGADCAYVSAASSYFDRYWSQGNFQKRYFLHCVAEDAATPRAA